MTPRLAPAALALWLTLPALAADDPPAASDDVSFMKQLAPLFAENCVGCHNPKKPESKYDMTTFERLAKGGQYGEDITLIPGKPDESYLVELLQPDASPRMPHKQDPLPPDSIALIEKWVAQGAKYDGNAPTEDWVALSHRTAPVNIPDRYPVTLPITALAFSPDGSHLVASGYHELTEWNPGDGALALRVPGLRQRIYDVAFSPDGKWLATASGDPGQYGVVQLWKTDPTGKAEAPRVLAEAPDAVFAVAFSPDSSLVAAAGADRSVRVWKTESGESTLVIEDHADWVLDVAFSPDGKRLATASRDKTSKVFDLESKQALVTFPGHAASVTCVSFTPDGKQVASGGEDNQIRLWNPDEEGKQVAAIGGFGGSVFRLLYSPDGKDLIACSADKAVRIFTDNKPRLTLQGHQDWVYSLAISPDGATLASGSWDGDVRLWTRADGKPIRNFPAAPGLTPMAAP